MREGAVGPGLVENEAAVCAGGTTWVRVGRGFAGEAEGAFVEVILVDDEGVVGVGVFVEAGGEHEPGAEVHVASVEAAELVAAEPDEAKVAGSVRIGFLEGG